MDAVTLMELRRKARRQKPHEAPDIDTLKNACVRVFKSIGEVAETAKKSGIDTINGKIMVETGKNRDGSTRYGYKQYYAHVLVADIIAIGLHLEGKKAHDERTIVLLQGALGAKQKDGRMVMQLVDELEHMLEIAKATGV